MNIQALNPIDPTHLRRSLHQLLIRSPSNNLAPGPFHFKQCNPSSPNYLCGHLLLPLSYHNASDPRTVKLAVTMYQPHPGKKSENTVLMNPGGPGGSGTNFIWRKGEYYAGLMDGEYDVLSWDPRGGSDDCLERDTRNPSSCLLPSLPLSPLPSPLSFTSLP